MKPRSGLFENLMRQRIAMLGRTSVDLTVGVQRPIQQPAHAAGEHLEDPPGQSFGGALDRVV